MNNLIPSDKPTIYADMNIFRYISYGELEITNHSDFQWVFSHVHLDEITRNGNKDALDGMKTLKAIEVYEQFDERCVSLGTVAFRPYIDPYERYESHLDAISGVEFNDDLLLEPLLRMYGAENLDPLRETPKLLEQEIDRLTKDSDPDQREELLKNVSKTGREFLELVDSNLSETKSIDETRKMAGITSSVREKAKRSDSPLEDIWKVVQEKAGKMTMNQFFGFEKNPHVPPETPHTQDGMLCGAYTVLNLIGLEADKGLSKKEKLKNTMSDGQHLGKSSYCNALMSTDRRFSAKSQIIFSHLKFSTNVLFFPFQKNGMKISLGISTRNEG